MTFWSDGRSYESRAMRQFLTDDPATPLILVTSDYRRVFLMDLDGGQSPTIRQANTLEIISLATRYGIRELLRAFPAPVVSDVEVDYVANLGRMM